MYTAFYIIFKSCIHNWDQASKDAPSWHKIYPLTKYLIIWVLYEIQKFCILDCLLILEISF